MEETNILLTRRDLNRGHKDRDISELQLSHFNKRPDSLRVFSQANHIVFLDDNEETKVFKCRGGA